MYKPSTMQINFACHPWLAVKYLAGSVTTRAHLSFDFHPASCYTVMQAVHKERRAEEINVQRTHMKVCAAPGGADHVASMRPATEHIPPIDP
jgi:hypothetical protein